MLFGFAYVLSGAAGLLYQVAWLRHLTLAFGHTHAAVSTVLAGFLGGLALGAAIADRAATLPAARVVRLYAVLELAIAAYAVALPFLVGIAAAFSGSLYGESGGAGFALARSASALVVVALPATLMGATFPLAVRVGAGFGPNGLGASALYTLNTIGATAGAALTGFVLLPALGFWKTALIGAAFNAAACLLALAVARTSVVGDAADDTTPQPVAAESRRRPARNGRQPRPASTSSDTADASAWAVHAGALVSGFAVLALEVAWTRILTLVLGPTTWAFALMLTIFIGGLALGAVLGTWGSRRTSTPGLWMGLALAAGAIAIVLTPGTVGSLIVDVARASALPDASVAAVLRTQGLAVAFVLLPKTLTLGASFPLALAATLRRSHRSGTASRVGRLYAVNTIGAIAGSLAAGFVLLPRLGLHDTLTLVAVTLVIGTGVVLLAGWPRVRATLTVTALLAVVGAAAWLGPRLDARLLSSGAYKYAAYLGDTDVEAGLTAGELLYYRDGGTATVSVRRVGGVTSLAIDGKVDASDGGDMLTQKLLGHVPLLLLHPGARDVAVIGLGSGVTPGAVLQHGVTAMDVLEISPEVVEASSFFGAVNRTPLADPRTRLIVGDARAHFLFTRRVYDVVISEPSNPWMAGMAALFTQEFFAAVRQRLSPGGIMCQWTHTYDMGTEEFGSILKTFRRVFPHVLVWLVGEGDVLLVGADRPLVDALTTMPPWRPAVGVDLASVGIDRTFPLLSLVAGANALADRLAESGGVQTDDRLTLEFSAPRFILGRSASELSDRLRTAAAATRLPAIDAIETAASAADWRARASMLLRALAYRPAYAAAQRALERDASDVAAVHLLLDAASGARRVDKARDFLSRLKDVAPATAAPLIGLSRIAAARGDFATALSEAQAALERAPQLAAAIEQLASVLADAGDGARLSVVVAELQRLFPERAATWYFEASRRFLAGDFAGAVAAGHRAVDAGDVGARAWNLIGAGHASRQEPALARSAFEQARRADRLDLTSLLNLARLEDASGNAARAEALYGEALSIDPRSRDALAALAVIAERQGDRNRAAHLRSLAGA